MLKEKQVQSLATLWRYVYPKLWSPNLKPPLFTTRMHLEAPNVCVWYIWMVLGLVVTVLGFTYLTRYQRVKDPVKTNFEKYFWEETCTRVAFILFKAAVESDMEFSGHFGIKYPNPISHRGPKFITSVQFSRNIVENVETIYIDPRSWTEVMRDFRTVLKQRITACMGRETE